MILHGRVIEQAIDRGFFLRLFDSAQTAEPIGGGAKTIGVVVDECVLGGETASEFVEFGSPTRRDEESFENGDLAVFVEIGVGRGDRFGEVLAETSEVLFVPAARGADNHAIGG